jgi:hypothetical protein
MITIEDLTEAELREFLSRVRNPTSGTVSYKRRVEMRSRWSIQHEDFDHLIYGRLRSIYHKAETVQDVAKWAQGLFNPQKTAVRRVAVGYKRRPTRRMGSKSRTEDLHAFYKRLRFGQKASHLHTLSVAMNRILVVARPLRDKRGPVVGFEAIAGDRAEVITEPGTTDDHPPAILGVLLPEKATGRQTIRAEGTGNAKILTIDGRWFTTWDAQGNVVEDETFEHGLGQFPGAWMSHTPPAPGDAFDGLTGRGLTATTLEVGSIAANMGWTRKTQCRHLLSLLFDDALGIDEDGAAEGQTIGDPEGILSLNGENIQLLVSDLNTAITDFLTHIDALERRAFEQLTGAPALPMAGPAAQNPEIAAASLHAASAEVHTAIVEGLEFFEADIAEVAAAMGRRIGMNDVPDPKAIRDEFTAQFPTLPYIDTPKERNEVWQERIKMGVGDAVEFRAEIDGTSEAEAEKRVLELAERQARLDKIRTTHGEGEGNAVSRPELPNERPEARTGRFGGQASPPPESAAQ